MPVHAEALTTGRIMKVIPETRNTNETRYISICFNQWLNTSVEELLVPEGIIRPVVSASACTWKCK
jgi:hypothetical protein